ncbi:PH domain-containing protein [Actinopolyspora halophila]|uniref:PH domain-containing protein n=1 Tax=Actinopolyspora halophila TaxID=1850 RepID=UPI00035E2B73|nr:PH domain-containing protein [Actinopolyspora halophila]
MSETRDETTDPDTAASSGSSTADERPPSAGSETGSTPVDSPEEDAVEASDPTPPTAAPKAAPTEEGLSEGGRAEDGTARAPRLVFRFTRVSLLVLLIVAVCISPVAASIPWLSLLYLVPFGLLYWVIRMRTLAGPSGLTTRSLFRTESLEWTEIKALRLDERRWVRAITHSDREVPLPVVRVRDVPRLAATSGGRLRDPLAPADDDGGPDRE